MEAMTFGSFAVGSGCWLRHVEERLKRYKHERETWVGVIGMVEKKRRTFLREVLATATDRRLHLCESASDLPNPLPLAPGETAIALSPAKLYELRARIRKTAQGAGLNTAAIGELVMAGSEAALNAVVHARCGTAEIRSDASRGRMQLWIRDKGPGIDDAMLHRATLEAGFSSKGTLGQGFALIISTSRRAHLLTGAGGTTIVLEV